MSCPVTRACKFDKRTIAGRFDYFLRGMAREFRRSAPSWRAEFPWRSVLHRTAFGHKVGHRQRDEIAPPHRLPQCHERASYRLKRALRKGLVTSGLGHKRTLAAQKGMSVLPRKRT